MKIYIVRHGQVNHNLYKIYDNIDEDLNENGLNQAKELRKKIEEMNLKYDIIITSPLIRAKHTAEIINFKNKEIIMNNRLIERDPKNLSGKSIYDTDREEYWNYNTKIQYGNSENIKDFMDRVFEFIDELKNKKEYESVLITAHSGVSRAFDAYFNEIQDGKLLKRGLKNCEIKEYIIK